MLLGYQQDGYRSILKIILLHTISRSDTGVTEDNSTDTRISVVRIQEYTEDHPTVTRTSVGQIQEYTGDNPAPYFDISRTDTGVCWRSSCSILGYQQAGYRSILEIILLLLGYQQDGYRSILEIILLHTSSRSDTEVTGDNSTDTRISVGRIQEYT